MKHRSFVGALLLSLPALVVLGACDSEPDIDERAALEQEALERDLNLALEPDTTVEAELADVPLARPEAQTEAPPARVATQPAPRRTTPRASQPQTSTPREPAPAPAPEPSRPRTVTMPVPSGTTMALQMDQELSTRNASVGESFTATLADPIIAADGTTLIPAGATVRGRVTGMQESGRAGETAFIKLAFEAVSFGGRSYPMAATVVDAPVKTVTRDSKKEQATKIAGGAAVGAVLGQVIGKNTKSTVAGAAIGAAAGTAVAMGTADVDAVIPQGARVIIRLDSPVQVTKTVS